MKREGAEVLFAPGDKYSRCGTAKSKLPTFAEDFSDPYNVKLILTVNAFHRIINVNI